MNRTSDLTRRLWAALLALCLTLSLALPVFAEGESDTEPETKETYHIGTVDELLQLAGKKRGYLVSGGEVNTERMAKALMDDYRSGKLGKLTLESPEDMQ